jgi:cell division protein FtsZ
MPQIKPDVEAFARIKVIGVGGSGKNAVNHMIDSKVRGVDFIAVNTDAQDLHHSLAKKKIHIGKNLTRGLGTGMNPELGKRAAEETKEEIQEAIKGADMVFIACGMGGGTGTGAAPAVARTAKEAGCLTVAVVTKPFFFEGLQRMRIAEAGIEELKQSVDAIIIIPNDRLLSTIDKDTTAKNAFAMCDDILRRAVEGISDLVTSPGIINIDFADIRAVMENAGPALMGIGYASGEKRAEEAARTAINSPLLEVSIAGAKGVLFSIAGGDDLTMFEIQDAAKVITESVDPNARIIFGTVREEKLKKGEIKITVIASGFPESLIKKSLFQDEPRGNSEDKKGKIFNSVPTFGRTDKADEPKDTVEINEVPKAQTLNQIDESDDDDWGAVPAFLRRSKLK